jgi:hypothetical protein
LSDWNLWSVWKDHPDKQKSLPGGPWRLGPRCYVKRLASRRPPTGKRRKGRAENTQSCASPRGLHVSVKRMDICRCYAHARINARQYLFCQWFDSICMVHDGFPSVQSKCREMATVRVFRCSNGRAVRLPKEFHLKLKTHQQRLVHIRNGSLGDIRIAADFLDRSPAGRNRCHQFNRLPKVHPSLYGMNYLTRPLRSGRSTPSTDASARPSASPWSSGRCVRGGFSSSAPERCGGLGQRAPGEQVGH